MSLHQAVEGDDLTTWCERSTGELENSADPREQVALHLISFVATPADLMGVDETIQEHLENLLLVLGYVRQGDIVATCFEPADVGHVFFDLFRDEAHTYHSILNWRS